MAPFPVRRGASSNSTTSILPTAVSSSPISYPPAAVTSPSSSAAPSRRSSPGPGQSSPATVAVPSRHDTRDLYGQVDLPTAGCLGGLGRTHASRKLVRDLLQVGSRELGTMISASSLCATAWNLAYTLESMASRSQWRCEVRARRGDERGLQGLCGRQFTIPNGLLDAWTPAGDDRRVLPIKSSAQQGRFSACRASSEPWHAAVQLLGTMRLGCTAYIQSPPTRFDHPTGLHLGVTNVTRCDSLRGPTVVRELGKPSSQRFSRSTAASICHRTSR